MVGRDLRAIVKILIVEVQTGKRLLVWSVNTCERGELNAIYRQKYSWMICNVRIFLFQDEHFLSGSLDGVILHWSSSKWECIGSYNYVEQYLGQMKVFPYSVQCLRVFGKVQESSPLDANFKYYYYIIGLTIEALFQMNLLKYDCVILLMRY